MMALFFTNYALPYMMALFKTNYALPYMMALFLTNYALPYHFGSVNKSICSNEELWH